MTPSHRTLIEQWAERFDIGDIAGMLELAAPAIAVVMPGTEIKGRETSPRY